MELAPGTRLGNFEILAKIGEGGMGEVYKAWDPSLDRAVAIKVLPAKLAWDADLRLRFEQEAKAVAALSHPNVLGIFGFDIADGLIFAVMELLEGENLRQRMRAGVVPIKRVVEIAIEVASGLSAAHEQGIVHRDVKPENIFLTHDGRVKILDFGLAKQVFPSNEGPGGSGRQVSEVLTTPGMVMGSIGYLSPEQVQGLPADHRSDIFAFGVVLYEMLFGDRPFRGESPAHTLAAILNHEPELITERLLPADLVRVVMHCLEKRPEARFQSMKDLGFALQNLGGMFTGPTQKTPRSQKASISLMGYGFTLLLLALGFLCHTQQWPPFRPPLPPTFKRLTHIPGTVESAFFGPDGKTLYFTERIHGQPPEIFVMRPDASEPQSLGLQNARLLGVSETHELATLRFPRPWYGTSQLGMLARAPSEGGSFKDLQENVIEATWDGKGMALVRHEGESRLLEFPVGHVILKSPEDMRICQHLRVSRDGAYLALVDSDYASQSEIVLYSRKGERKTLLTKVGDIQGDTLNGLAWGPHQELWFSELEGDQTLIWSLSRKGRKRLLWRCEGTKALMDVSSDGRALLADQQVRKGVLVQNLDTGRFSDVSVFSSTQAMGMSDQGQLLLVESPVLDGGTAQDLTFTHSVSQGPAVRLAQGTAYTQSPDGRWVQMALNGMATESLDPSLLEAYRTAGMDPKTALASPGLPHLLFVPTGAGRPWVLALPKTMDPVLGYAFLHPDGNRVIFSANQAEGSYWFEVDRRGGEPKALTPKGFGAMVGGLDPVSPDGTHMVLNRGDDYYLQALNGGQPKKIQGLRAKELPLRWASDSRSLYVRSGTHSLSVEITRLEVATGKRHPITTYAPADPSGMQMIRSVYMTPDAKHLAFTYIRKLSELYQVSGIQ